MVYYVFDKFESSIGNALLRLNTSRSMALTFPTVPGKYYEMSFGRSIAAFDVNRSSDVGTFFNLLKKALGLISTLICHNLTHLNRWPSHFLIDRRRLLWNEFHNYLPLQSISLWIYTEHCLLMSIESTVVDVFNSSSVVAAIFLHFMFHSLKI